MKKRILSFTLVLLLLFGMIPMTLLSAFAEGVGELIDDDPPKPKISIEPVTVHGSYDNAAKPDASGYAHFKIKADVEITSNITVYYKTKDGTAIAAAGDYEAQSGAVVLTPEMREAEILVKTERTEYSVTVLRFHGNPYYSRSFEVLLTDVDGYAEIDSTKSSAKASLNAENNFEMIFGTPIFTAYTLSGSYKIHDFFVTPAIDSDFTYQKVYTPNFPAIWRNYLDSGVDAKIYMGINDAHIDESWWNSSSNVTVQFAGTTVYMSGEFHNNAWFGWGSAFYYLDTDDAGDEGVHKNSYEDNFEGMTFGPHSGGNITVDLEDDTYKASTSLQELKDKKYVILRDSSNSWLGHGLTPNNYFISRPDSLLDYYNFTLRFTSHGGFSRKLTGGDLVFILEDITAPKMEKSGSSYEIYHNFDTVVEGEKLRIAIRFNEPVRIESNNPYIIGKVNGRGTGVQTDPYYIRFDYVEGTGTDTLCFEAEYNKDYLITSITDMVMYNDSNIKDFAYEKNSFTSEKFSISGFSLDRRVPVINVDHSSFKPTNDPIRSTSIDVTVSQITDGTTLYYSWTDNIGTPTTYDHFIELDNISIYESQTVPISTGGDGRKYLHMMAVSRYGKSTITIFNSKTGMSQNYIGPFNFDNSAPTFGESVLPIEGESDMTKKVYKIPLPVDNPNGTASGFYDLKMYCIMPDGTEMLIEREKILPPHNNSSYDENSIIPKDFNTVENGKNYLMITLEAGDIGIGEKTRVENVTVFFTLTDNLGNTATNVSKHTVVFDTNDYIDVSSAGSSPSFSTKTEVLNGENTLIYSNDKSLSSGGKTVYYSFEFKIKEASNDCNNVFSLIKRGAVREDDRVITDGYVVRTIPDAETGEKLLILEFTSPIESGAYDIQLLCYDNDSLVTDKADRVSQTYRIYVGEGVGQLGEKINSGTLLINKVYQLPSTGSLYYMSRPDDVNSPVTVESVLTDLYNKDKLSMSFSSYEAARKFVLFNEYRDLYAVTLTEAMAEALNNKTSTIQPAQGESIEAKAGQVWIRYKSISWTIGNKQTSNWVYYYYGNTEVIDPDNFSYNLNEALNYVVDTVTKSGKTVALTDLSLKNHVGHSLVDVNGVPYLAPSQIVPDDLYITDSTNKVSEFAKEIRYAKDTAIYSSNVVKNDSGIVREYFLVGNLVIPTGSRFQYRRYNSIGAGYVSEEWIDITTDGTKRFRDVILESGWYEIRELGVDGTSLFDVYIDKSAPSVFVTWNDKDGASSTQWLNSESEKDFRAGTFQITAIDNNEADKYSYVAIYGMLNSELYGVYTVTELQRSPVSLDDGKYYMIVADRSGNSYYLSLYINSSNLNCDFDEVKNTRFRFICDRDPSQIQSFYVKRNGVRVDNVQYASTITFVDSGMYEFYVEDIYGNSFGPYEYKFTRDYPLLEWSYQTSDGSFAKYDETNPSNTFKVDKISDGSYNITTSVPLRYHITGDYVCTFIGTPPETTQNDIYGYVTVKSAQSFQLKVAYRSHPDVYTIYNCSADRSAPSITVSAQVNDSVPAEIDLLKNEISNALAAGNPIGILGSITEEGETVNGRFLIPSTIAYSVNGTQSKILADGEIVLSDFIRVNVQDENGLSKQEIYLNGELISLQNSETKFSEVVLNRYGEYRIVAQDALGNVSEFSFKNASPDAFEYRVDGKLIELGIHDYRNFDKDLNYNLINFGNASVSFTISEKMSVFYMITDADGEKKFVAFDVDDGVIRALNYFLRDGGTTPELVVGNVLFNAYAGGYAYNTEFVVYEDGGIAILAKLDSNGDTVLTVYSLKDEVITVESRLNTTDREFYYNKTELSTRAPELIIKVDGKVVEQNSPTGQININKPFEISPDNFVLEDIVAVEVYFSYFNDLDEGKLSGKENIYSDYNVYADEGFYLVRGFDKYGTACVYRIHISNDFEATPYVDFSDGQRAHYSPNYNKKLFSDLKIVFEIHSGEVVISVNRNGSVYAPKVSVEDGITYLTLDEEGEYTLFFYDMYGNILDYIAEIDFSRSNFNENLLFGYNENALKKSEGYTNQRLSVNESILKEELSYLAFIYGDTLTVLYDEVSEDTVAFDSEDLVECIGKLGDGKYSVIVRDKHGAKATKTIYYRETPTLKLERETRSTAKPEAYSLEDAVSIGFWSNNSLIFTSEAGEYVFTINGDKTECPKTISFASSGQHGRNEYDITYIDEYGFSYTFRAYLSRQELSISASTGITTQFINDMLTTRDNISVVFSDDATCTYTLNHSEKKVYTPGEKLTADGVYRFTVVDHAGNVAAYTIKKDTIPEFYFKTNKSPSIHNGEVVNYSKVEFCVSNNDSAYIEKVLRNGVVQSDFTGTTFYDDGRWEVIIADKLGNRAYFCFYIISYEQNGFTYTTPYEYHITELWYDDGDGVKTSYISFVDRTDFTSSFDFKENGTYYVTMMSDLTGEISSFEFTVNTTAPKVYLVGCNEGETTINDVSIAGCKVGDRIKIYRATEMGEELVQEVEITSLAMQMPVISEGGEYRVVVESEAGVTTELNFVRKHVMNTSGSVFIMIIVGIAAVGLFAGLVYRNKSKTDD